MSTHDKVILGLDIGGSTAKAAALRGSKLLTPCRVAASDPLSSAYGALGRFLDSNHLGLEELDRVIVTGVGTSQMTQDLLGIPTYLCEEFRAVARGGLYLSGQERAVVVSMGTGTSLVLGEGEQYRHIIGSGLGGGTLMGLASSMLQIRDFKKLNRLAAKGTLSAIDLSIGDLGQELPGLPPETTAANFGKVKDLESREDLAAGLVNLVFQPLGTIAVLAAELTACPTIVFVGSLAESTEGQNVFSLFGSLYHKELLVPNYPEFATAIGAALSQKHAVRITDLLS